MEIDPVIFRVVMVGVLSLCFSAGDVAADGSGVVGGGPGSMVVRVSTASGISRETELAIEGEYLLGLGSRVKVMVEERPMRRVLFPRLIRWR